MQNEAYLDFILLMLKNLEPKQIEPKKVIQKQNQQIEEIIFLVNGAFEVGYNH